MDHLVDTVEGARSRAISHTNWRNRVLQEESFPQDRAASSPSTLKEQRAQALETAAAYLAAAQDRLLRWPRKSTTSSVP